MTRLNRWLGCALPLALGWGAPALAQDLQNRPVAPPPAPDGAPPVDASQVQFSSDALDYDSDADVVTATGDVRMTREGKRLRADKVVWNRKTGKVLATGNIAVTNPDGDTAYGDSIDLTDTLKDGIVENMLVVLKKGGRIAAREGTRAEDGSTTLRDAAYTPCAVTGSDGCPKEPSWKITAVRVTYRPAEQRIYYHGAALHLFGLPGIPLPSLSNPTGESNSDGLLSPSIGVKGVNGLAVSVPYFLRLAPNKGLTITPTVFTAALPMLGASYQQLTDKGAFRLTGYATVSRRSDDLITGSVGTTETFRGYLDGVARFQLSPEWTLTSSIRVATDKTFLRRYDISYDDRLRNTVKLEHIDANSYFVIDGWAVQTMRINDAQGQQPLALPEIDYRRRIPDSLLGGVVTAEVNTLALTRGAGQDTQRAFASLEWDLRKITPMGQTVTFTAFARGDVYNSQDTLSTDVAVYRGTEGFQGRAIGAFAIDVQWPFVGGLWGGIQRLTPRVQVVLSPKIKNLAIPNEDSRSVDLDDSNLFALNRFPGYDRYEDSSRVTYGVDWAVNLRNLTLDNQIGQSFRFATRSNLFFPGTGLSDQLSDIVGRSEARYKDFLSLTLRYRLDKDDLAIRRAEADVTIGSRDSYLLLGYSRLNRNIQPLFEDLQDSEEARVAGRIQFARFWSAFGSIVVDLTDRSEDPLSLANGFSPIRHRLGLYYEDDCLKLGLTWRRDYSANGDARAGNAYLLSISFKSLGR